MSRRIDFEKPLSEDEVQYLADRDDPRLADAKVAEPEGEKKAPAKK